MSWVPAGSISRLQKQLPSTYTWSPSICWSESDLQVVLADTRSSLSRECSQASDPTRRHVLARERCGWLNGAIVGGRRTRSTGSPNAATRDENHETEPASVRTKNQHSSTHQLPDQQEAGRNGADAIYRSSACWLFCGRCGENTARFWPRSANMKTCNGVTV